MNAKPELGAEFEQIRNASGTAFSKGKMLPDIQLTRADPIAQDLLRKLSRAQRGKGRREFKKDDLIDTGGLEPGQLLFRCRQKHEIDLRGQDLDGMGIECQDERRPGLATGCRHHPVEKSPVTMVMTVKISDGHNRIGSGRGRGETAGNLHAGRDWRSLAASLAK